jgi:hypothetical protein
MEGANCASNFFLAPRFGVGVVAHVMGPRWRQKKIGAEIGAKIGSTHVALLAGTGGSLALKCG